MKKNYINEEVIYEASKRFKPYLELFLGVLLALLLAYFQLDMINAISIDGKFFILLFFTIIILQSFDYFFLEILLSKKNIYIKSIFTLGRLVRININKIKAIKVSKLYFKNQSDQGNIILILSNGFPIPIGIIKDVNNFKNIFENTLKEIK